MSHTVLICDDIPYMRTLLGTILKRAGFEVIGEAASGAQAIEQYKALRPDVVMLDIVMPDMGGIDALREILKADEHARVLMCSGMGQHSLVAEAIEAGARDFVVKPFQPNRLLEAMQLALT